MEKNSIFTACGVDAADARMALDKVITSCSYSGRIVNTITVAYAGYTPCGRQFEIVAVVGWEVRGE